MLNGSTFSARRNILKPDVSGLNATRYSNIEKTFANVQNSYAKFNGDVLVASSSLPRYNANPLEFYDRIVELNGEYSGELFTLQETTDITLVIKFIITLMLNQRLPLVLSVLTNM